MFMGGAGVHVEYLSRELAKKIEVEIHCWGDQESDNGRCMFMGRSPGKRSAKALRANSKTALETVSLNLTQVKGAIGCGCCAYPYLVCIHVWISGEEVIRHSLCADHTQLGAAAGLES